MNRREAVRRITIIIWIAFLFGGIGALFWYNEWRYSLPTPVPTGYIEVNPGEILNIRSTLVGTASKPTLIHFFNPDCPCSRFNIPHFKSLVKQYGDKVNFAIVPLILKGKHYSAAEIQKRFGLDIAILFEPNLAALCGVYSTPQAVIIDSKSRLFYRGNYNRSRYCTDKKSNYAQLALEALLQKAQNPIFSSLALQAYGCQITTCGK